MSAKTVASALLIAIIGLAVAPRDAAAQLDPLLFLEQKSPNIIVMIDTSIRMLQDQTGATPDNADERTRITITRRSVAEAVNRNLTAARFGLMKTRQRAVSVLLVKPDAPNANAS